MPELFLEPDPRSNPDGDALTYSAAGLPAGLVLNAPARRSADSAASAGAAPAGVCRTFTLKLSFVPVAPTGDRNATGGDTASAVVTVLDLSDGPLPYEAAGLPPGTRIDLIGG